MNKDWQGYLAASTIVAFLAFAPTPAAAQDAGAPYLDTSTRKMMSSTDTMFAIAAAQGGVAEVRLGELALSKAGSHLVKAFGQRMVDDHSKANDRLKDLAQKQNMTLPATMSSKDQALYEKLQKLSGADFDKLYMKSMVKDHEQDTKEFKKEARNGKDPELKNFAAQTLPVLESHLSDARSTVSQLGSGS